MQTHSPDPTALPTPRCAYVHIPFCAHRCGYCNFTVVAGRYELADRVVAAIGRELSLLERPFPVDTLYFGGGTPTQLDTARFAELCRHVLRWHPLHPQGEWTVEANPEHLDDSRIEELASLGVNRISLGGQSFLPHKLRVLERNHNARQIKDAVVTTRNNGMQVAVDLIFSVPGETLDDWRSDLEQLIDLCPDHISTYGLTVEQGTAFWNRRLRGLLTEVDEDLQRRMYLEAIECLTASGYEHYEVSNFALPGARSRHNQTYWDGKAYFAVGPGASRYVGGVRETNHRSTTTYLRRIERNESPIAESESLLPEARARERLIFGLRKLEGVGEREFAVSTGFELDALAGAELRRFVACGWLEWANGRVRLTRDGLLVSDALWPDLV